MQLSVVLDGLHNFSLILLILEDSASQVQDDMVLYLAHTSCNPALSLQSPPDNLRSVAVQYPYPLRS
jgi:hypothetical protein